MPTTIGLFNFTGRLTDSTPTVVTSNCSGINILAASPAMTPGTHIPNSPADGASLPYWIYVAVTFTAAAKQLTRERIAQPIGS